MPMRKHEATRSDLVPRPRDFVDRFFDDVPELFRRPVLFWPERVFEQLKVEEYRENGTEVFRIDSPGIDPEKDVEVSVSDDILSIRVERREEESEDKRDYHRQELRYGRFERDLPLPKGTKPEAVSASYKDGVLEVRLPVASKEPQTTKVKVEAA